MVTDRFWHSLKRLKVSIIANRTCNAAVSSLALLHTVTHTLSICSGNWLNTTHTCVIHGHTWSYQSHTCPILLMLPDTWSYIVIPVPYLIILGHDTAHTCLTPGDRYLSYMPHTCLILLIPASYLFNNAHTCPIPGHTCPIPGHICSYLPCTCTIPGQACSIPLIPPYLIIPF